MTPPIFSKPNKKIQRLVRIVSVGDASYVAIGRLVENVKAPEFAVGKLLVAVFDSKTRIITLTPYDTEDEK